MEREDNRLIEEEDRDFLERTAFDDWVAGLWEEASEAIDRTFLTLEKLEWIMEKLAEG